VKIIAVSVLAHRVLVRTEALKDYADAAAVIREILTTVQVQKL
jgi:hypothetical protein